MKKAHLLAIAIIVVAIGIIMSTTADASVYVSFGEARQRAAEGNQTKVHIVGRLPRDHQKNPVGLEYDPLLDPNHFAFTLIDTNRVAQRVIYYSPKPQDFDKSEQVVITGASHTRLKRMIIRPMTTCQNIQSRKLPSCPSQKHDIM